MTSKTVPKLTLIDRAGVHYLRVMVPKDLRDVLKKDKFVESTKTSDKRQAELIASRRYTEILESFETARRRLNPQPVSEVTPELGKVLADRVRAKILSLDDHTRNEPTTAGALYAFLAHQANHGRQLSPTSPPPGFLPGPDHPAFMGATPGMVHATRTFHSDNLVLYRGALADGDLRAALPAAKREAQALGLLIDWHSKTQAPQIAAVLRMVLVALVEAHEALVQRDLGRVVHTPALEAPAPALKPKTLRDVFDKWKASKKRPEDTERACERALILFETWAKRPSLDKITRQTGIDFRAHLLTLGTSSKTARDRMNWLLSLLKFAAQDLEWLPKHPWLGLSIDAKTTNKRRPWKLDELQRFFALPLFTAYDLPTMAKAGKDAAYWVPLLGLFTGARIGELCQLQVEDIDTEVGVMHIRDDAEGQQLKTENAARTIPVHSELVRLGFLEFVNQCKRPGKLWPKLPLRAGKPSGYLSQWFNETRKAAPVSLDTLPDFHCFRHTVRTKMTEAGISEAVQDRITGHALTGSTGTRVYAHPVEILRTAVESIQYPGLNLPRAYKAPAK